MLKKLILSLGLLLAATLPYQANAQVPAGPFQNQSELVAAWQQLYDTYRVASHATLDGVSVFRKSGFGPALTAVITSAPTIT
jgi:hypothetical protein